MKMAHFYSRIVAGKDDEYNDSELAKLKKKLSSLADHDEPANVPEDYVDSDESTDHDENDYEAVRHYAQKVDEILGRIASQGTNVHPASNTASSSTVVPVPVPAPSSEVKPESAAPPSKSGPKGHEMDAPSAPTQQTEVKKKKRAKKNKSKRRGKKHRAAGSAGAAAAGPAKSVESADETHFYPPVPLLPADLLITEARHTSPSPAPSLDKAEAMPLGEDSILPGTQQPVAGGASIAVDVYTGPYIVDPADWHPEARPADVHEAPGPGYAPEMGGLGQCLPAYGPVVGQVTSVTVLRPSPFQSEPREGPFCYWTPGCFYHNQGGSSHSHPGCHPPHRTCCCAHAPVDCLFEHVVRYY
ncbi:hypothetical protein N7532_000477 [Penicillium argentinense]|uniref:Uncharacterized protein n=1 Tax=Penicillium argentinense TaxID=1131581 RepID=A0A9W9G6T6_9EURO|nr:uncharacterized protein N7532_000477 [Penicillium argentinense]KAJ5112432.1 hypothetical protein N7532_000477 [Penicillium argentinense]